MNVVAEGWKELLHGVCWDESGDWVLLRGFPRAAGVSVTVEEFRGAKAPPMLNESDANGQTDDNTNGKINKKRKRQPSPADADPTSQCRWEPDKGLKGYHDLFSQRREPSQFFHWKPEHMHAEMLPCQRDFSAGCPVQRWRLWGSSRVWRDS